MTAAHDYDHLHHLVDRLSPMQARRLRLIITQDEELSQVEQETSAASACSDADSDDAQGEEGLPDGFLALIGSISAPADYAEHHDEYVRERMERHLGDAR